MDKGVITTDLVVSNEAVRKLVYTPDIYAIELTVNGEKKNEHELQTMITSLPAMDLQKISNNIDKLNQQVGLENILYITCPKCGEEVSTFFRFGPEFFRPTTI